MMIWNRSGKQDSIPLSQHFEIVARHEARHEARYDALLDKYTSLKMQGAVEVPKPVDVPRGTIGVQQPDELRDLIDAKAGSNLRVRKMMLRQLAEDRAADMDEDAIRQRIEHGVTSNGIPA